MLTKIMIVQKDIVTAVINNDYSGLNEEDKKAAYQFCELVGTQTISIDSPVLDFIRCQVTGLHADCYEISLHSFESKNESEDIKKLHRIEELRHLISCHPNDIKLLKEEYRELTGKQYRTKRGE